MPTFTYKAIAPDGTNAQGTIEAYSKSQAVQQLSQENYAVYDIAEGASELSEAWYNRQLFQSAQLKDAEIVEISQGLSAMLEQHLSIDDALRITAEASQTPRIRQSMERIRVLLGSGSSVETAFATLHDTFPPEFLAIIRAGATSNSLSRSFSSAAIYYARRGALKQKLLGAAAYPFFLIVAAALVFFVILLTMIPALHDTIVSAGNDADGLIGTLNNLSNLLRSYWQIFVVAVLASIATGLIFRRFIGRLIRRSLPPLRKSHNAKTFAGIARILHMLLQSGEQLDRALKEAIDATTDRLAKDTLENALAAVRKGETAGPIFVEDKDIPVMFGRIFDLGERTNNLQSLLELAADGLEAGYEKSLSRMTGLITPLLTLAVGGLIAFLVQVLISAVLEVSQVAI